MPFYVRNMVTEKKKFRYLKHKKKMNVSISLHKIIKSQKRAREEESNSNLKKQQENYEQNWNKYVCINKYF